MRFLKESEFLDVRMCVFFLRNLNTSPIIYSVAFCICLVNKTCYEEDPLGLKTKLKDFFKTKSYSKLSVTNTHIETNK